MAETKTTTGPVRHAGKGGQLACFISGCERPATHSLWETSSYPNRYLGDACAACAADTSRFIRALVIS